MSELIGHRPTKEPLRTIKLPLDICVPLIDGMDAWQLCHLVPSLILPMCLDEVTGLLVTDFDRRRLRSWTRFGDRDFNKGRRTFEMPFPPQLEPLLRACIGGRTDGPLLRRRAVFEGREQPPLAFEEAGDVEAAYEAVLLAADRRAMKVEQVAKVDFQRVLRRAGGASPDQLSREFGGVLRKLESDAWVRFYDARAAVTTDMNRGGVPELELRYLTGHTRPVIS